MTLDFDSFTTLVTIAGGGINNQVRHPTGKVSRWVSTTAMLLLAFFLMLIGVGIDIGWF